VKKYFKMNPPDCSIFIFYHIFPISKNFNNGDTTNSDIKSCQKHYFENTICFSKALTGSKSKSKKKQLAKQLK